MDWERNLARKVKSDSPNLERGKEKRPARRGGGENGITLAEESAGCILGKRRTIS